MKVRGKEQDDSIRLASLLLYSPAYQLRYLTSRSAESRQSGCMVAMSMVAMSSIAQQGGPIRATITCCHHMYSSFWCSRLMRTWTIGDVSSLLMGAQPVKHESQ